MQRRGAVAGQMTQWLQLHETLEGPALPNAAPCNCLFLAPSAAVERRVLGSSQLLGGRAERRQLHSGAAAPFPPHPPTPGTTGSSNRSGRAPACRPSTRRRGQRS